VGNLGKVGKIWKLEVGVGHFTSDSATLPLHTENFKHYANIVSFLVLVLQIRTRPSEHLQ